MGRLRFEWLNAFTKRGMDVQGNPAAIAIVSRFPPEKEMKRAASLIGTNMTSFVVPAKQPDTYYIRHFSPDGKENHVCGHATVAAAESLARKFPRYRDGVHLTFLLNKKYTINDDNAFPAYIKGDEITLTMPAIMGLKEADENFHKRLVRALGIDRSDIQGTARYAPNIDNYILEIKDPERLQSLTPDFNKLSKLAKSRDYPHEGIMLTSKACGGHMDVLTRVFLPVIGVDEDVACGSSMCSVIPYWSAFSGQAFPPEKTDFVNVFPYPPGGGEGRLGGIQKVLIDHEKAEIKLTGQATFHGTVQIPLAEKKIPKGP